MSFNLADLFERIVDAVPDREALLAGERRLTYRQLDERANRLAHHLRDQGIGKGDHLGLQLVNGSEYLEGMLAAFKLRAVPINVNYRYVEGELRYLFDDADLVALAVNRTFAPRVAAVLGDLPKLRHVLVLDDTSDAEVDLPGAIDYEAALAAASPERIPEPRSSDDLYIVYTGGTTGMPKGVMWRHEDIFFAAMGGGDPFQSGNFIKTPDELAERLTDRGAALLATPPFMHAAAQWSAFSTFFGGGKVVVQQGGGFDPARIWELVAREQVNVVIFVGDAMAIPLIEELEANPGHYDTRSLIAVGSAGALLSPSTKSRMLEQLPKTLILDVIGSSETGTMANQTIAKGGEEPSEARFFVNEQTQVLDDDLQPIPPGSGKVGQIARKSRVPIGYYKDPEKSRATFVEIAGVRWALPGDMATVEEDGAIRLLGRGSVSINSGGEKIFPEEVEAALKGHADVYDTVVVGVPDPRWGQRVVAVIQARGDTLPSLEELRAFCADHIAAYKMPRDVVQVDEIVRSPAGKADYPWAKRAAIEALGAE